MSKEFTTAELIEKYLENGGTITRLRYASEKDISKSARRWRHKEKAQNGSAKSKETLEKEQEKESLMIFSKVDRWKS